MAFFDVEGTLIDFELLPELGKLNNSYDYISHLTSMGLNGSIDWLSGFYKRIDLLNGIKKLDVINANDFSLRNSVLDVINFLKQENFKIILVSGGFYETAKKVSNLVGADYFVCNNFVFENELINGVELIVKNKKYFAKNFINHFKPEKVVCVGDGSNDLGMLELGDYSFLIGKRSNKFQNVENFNELFERLESIL